MRIKLVQCFSYTKIIMRSVPLLTAPPSYEEAMGQQVSILEEDDSKYTMGNHQYAPAYGYFTYNNPSSQSGATGYNHEEAHL